MKILRLFAQCSVALLAGLSTQAQTFQNLDFEQANPGSVEFGPVPAATALPYWSVYYGTEQQTEIEYQGESTGTTEVALIGPGFGPIDGNYSVELTGGIGNVTPESASITQTGVIPPGTQSMLFYAQSMGFPGALEVQVGTQTVPIVAVGTGSDYTIYGANISAWANDKEAITFTAPSSASDDFDQWEIDDISFSQTAITPEPSPLVLAGIGGLLFAARKYFARH
jgi:hypothetical protein